MPHYDLIVIGSGPAGEKGAAQAAYFGRRVALVECHPRLGGACVNTGTLPSKTLRESALFLSGLRQRGLYGVEYQIPGAITVEVFMHRKERVVRKQEELTGRNIERHGIDLVHGRAVLADPHSVRVERPSGASVLLTGDTVLLATGSYPHRPANIPFDDRLVYDSDTILGLDAIPGSLAILGAGVIGCEYACLFAALGVDVVLIDARDRVLPFLDGEMAGLLTRRMQRLGIEILLQEETESFEVESGRVRTRMKSGRSVETEKLLFASGRSGNSRGMGLEAVGVDVSPRGYIQVNEHYQTTVPHIYAAGDVIGFPALASTAMEQGRLAVCHAFDLQYKIRLAPILPLGIYTIPEVSMAGETEETLRARGIEYEVGRAGYENNARGQITGDTEGLVKLLFAVADQKLLGVHILGEDATELVHVGMTCMYYGGSIDCFIQSVYNYPTLSEAYKYAAYDGLGRLARRQGSGG